MNNVYKQNEMNLEVFLNQLKEQNEKESDKPSEPERSESITRASNLKYLISDKRDSLKFGRQSKEKYKSLANLRRTREGASNQSYF